MNTGARAVLTLLVAAGAAGTARAQQATPYKESWRFVPPDGLLRNMRAITVPNDCMVWIADSDDGVYRVDCAGGSPLLVAATGKNSEDFQEPWVAGFAAGASAAIFDRGRQRVRSFGKDGESRERRDIQFPEGKRGEVAAVALTSDGARVWLYQFPNASDPGSLSSMVVAFHPGSSKRDTVFTAEGIPSIYWGSAFGASHLGTPHHRRPLLAFTPDGGFVTGTSDGHTVSVRNAAGKLIREIELEFATARPVNNADKDAFADSVRKSTDREMEILHYNAPEKKKYQAQISAYLREDVVYPAQRQLYERFVVDASGELLWVALTGTGKNYTRSWEIYALKTGAFQGRVSVPHKGAVTSASVQGGALYVVEQPLGGISRIAKYAER